ncbi:hypothetical protein [Methanothermococcus okinawensis]|uniref:Uncharacterized protein n=1 Tax=Methanothermococcus okinawensis (strain DSM 14208 / JCM 11175 / IH1) TaxID=647113 RepID=F8ANI4_METOI|nr:hypothetical protein [Methanothermococcus okinawensis]AEH07038.1 hypothetical protein Metok_1068 [Methanothermococcus okinawensis IH1]
MGHMKKIKNGFLNLTHLSKLKTILAIGVLSFMLCSVNAADVVKIVDNSPYPEFIYADNSIVPKIIAHNTGKNIPSFLFYFIDGVYSNLNNPNEVAIKTPLWFFGKLFMSGNNLNPENGYIFINSKYVGKPNDKWVNYLTPSDVIIYSNESAICARAHDKYTDINIIMYNNESIKQLISGLKSIDGIKVISSNAETKDNVLIGKLKLDANIYELMNMGNFDLYYVPIDVKVNGWNKKDQNTYSKGNEIISIYKLPVNKETIKNIIDEQLKNQNLKKVKESSYNGWDVVEYSYKNIGRQYACYKELEYGSVCVITDKIENLDDISISENK